MTNGGISVSFSNNRANEIEMGEKLGIRVAIPKSVGEPTDFKVLFNREGESPSIMANLQKTEEKENYYEYFAEVTFAKLGNYFFFFSFFTKAGEWRAIKINRETNKPFITTGESPYWRILVIQQGFEVPDWTKGTTYYQVVADRFNIGEEVPRIDGRIYRNWGDMPEYRRNKEGKFHNNDFFGGNLKGIEEKLDYFKKLSIGVIYMSPINYSTLRYDHYATTDFMQIDPNIGTFEDLDRLHKKANRMGIHLVLDIAVNHCSSDNPIFKDAISNPNSRYRDWFFINDDGTYKYWYNEFVDMPVFNQKNKGYQNYIYGPGSVIEKYAPYVDGFRLDVAEEIDAEVLEGIRRKANENGSHLIIAEWWNAAPIDKLGKCFDTTTNYLYTNAEYKLMIDGWAEYFRWQVQWVIENYPANTASTMLNSLDTHDMVRALTMLSGSKWIRHGNDRNWDIDKDPSPWHRNIGEKRVFLTDDFREDEFANDRLSPNIYRSAKKKLKILSLIQYFLVGNPCLYYGTEVGSHGYKDPFNRKTFPWNRIDKDLLRYYVKLGKVRRSNKDSLSGIEIKWIRCDEKVLCFERNNLTIIANLTSEEQMVEIPEGDMLMSIKKGQTVGVKLLADNGIVIKKRSRGS